MTIENYDLLGLIPFLAREDAAAILSPDELAIFNSIVDGVQGGAITHQPQITPSQIADIMDKLNVLPVWGKEGTKVYRMNLGDRLPIFIIAPDPEHDSVPPEVLTRKFVSADDLDGLVTLIQGTLADLSAGGVTGTVLPEDHPEFDSVGFICQEANTVFTITTTAIDASKDKPTKYAMLQGLIQSNEGRVELAKRIATGQLMSAEEFMAQYMALQPRTPEAAKVLRRKEQEVTIDLMSGKIADNYKKRYLPRAAAPVIPMIPTQPTDTVVPDQGGESSATPDTGKEA